MHGAGVLLLCAVADCAVVAAWPPRRPLTALQGAIIIFGIFPLFDGQEFFYLWKVSKFDW